MLRLVETLFTPFIIRHLTRPTRTSLAPMTRALSPGGVPGPDVAAYLSRCAETPCRPDYHQEIMFFLVACWGLISSSPFALEEETVCPRS
jgi:hypothetical protein